VEGDWYIFDSRGYALFVEADW